MKRILMTGICLLCCINLVMADSNNDLWQKANKHYVAKQYDSAVFYYEQAAVKQPSTAAIYYNLGNAYYRLNNIGLAALNYERALFLDPSNKQAAENLSLTQSRIGNRIPYADDIFFIDWWQQLVSGDKANMWAIISLIVFIALLGGLVVRRLGKMGWLPVQSYYILSSVLIVLLIISYNAAHNAKYTNAAVIMEPNATFAVAPGQVKAQSLIPEGTTVHIRNERNNWAEVSLPDGRIGWMELRDMVKVGSNK